MRNTCGVGSKDQRRDRPFEWRAPAMQPQRWVFAGDFEPDSVTKVAEPILVADNPGMASLALELRGPEVHAVNLYQIKVC